MEEEFYVKLLVIIWLSVGLLISSLYMVEHFIVNKMSLKEITDIGNFTSILFIAFFFVLNLFLGLFSLFYLKHFFKTD